MNISQSLVKSYIEYLMGDVCGIEFQRRYVTKDWPDEPTPAMELGNYFEFKATGYYHPERGEPEPILLKSGPNKGKPNADYARADEQAEKFKQYMESMEMEIEAAGERIETTLDDGTTLSGLVDVRARNKGKTANAMGVAPGESVIVDLKYSGLLMNKWDERGYHPDTFEYRNHHHIQPIQYMFMTGLRFFYFVFNPSPAMDAAMFEVVTTPDALEFHGNRISNIAKKLDVQMMVGGFKPRPEFNRCRSCPLFDECEHAAQIPNIYHIEIMPTYDPKLDS